jgi:hypothetical protein
MLKIPDFVTLDIFDLNFLLVDIHHDLNLVF